MVVSLLDGDEITELQLGDEPQLCEARGIQFWWFPIADRGIPPSRQNVLELVEALAAELATGKDLLVHCRQGIGRAGLLAACLLVYSGLDPGEAIKRLSELRGCTIPETAEQQRWILDFAQSLFTKLAK